eukprot:1924869-Rhodomonas_salina.1
MIIRTLVCTSTLPGYLKLEHHRAKFVNLKRFKPSAAGGPSRFDSELARGVGSYLHRGPGSSSLGVQ